MKERMLAAIESQDADWFAGAFRYFRKQYFGPSNSPYQFMMLGTSENVKGFDKKALETWYREKVLKSKRVLAVYGDIDVAAARDLVAKVFKTQVEAREARRNERVLDLVGMQLKDTKIPSINVARVEVQKTNNPQAAVFVGFKSDAIVGTPAEPALEVADCLTSGSGYPTGYIFEILRGRGLVYDANAFNFMGVDPKYPGAFIAYAGCDPKNVDECAAVILESIARLQGSEEDVQPTWFARSKKLIVTNHAIDNEAPDAQATLAAMHELFGLGYDYDAGFADRINQVSSEDVRNLADQSLEQCVITISTPQPELVKTKTGNRQFAKFPPVDLTPRGVQHDTGPSGK
jgi:predicted Zn-dependent peptidase